MKDGGWVWKSNRVIQQRGENVTRPPIHCSPVGEGKQKPHPKGHSGDPGQRRWQASRSLTGSFGQTVATSASWDSSGARTTASPVTSQKHVSCLWLVLIATGKPLFKTELPWGVDNKKKRNLKLGNLRVNHHLSRIKDSMAASVTRDRTHDVTHVSKSWEGRRLFSGGKGLAFSSSQDNNCGVRDPWPWSQQKEESLWSHPSEAPCQQTWEPWVPADNFSMMSGL